VINRRPIWAAFSLLLVAIMLSACGGAMPPMQNWPGLTVANGLVYAITGSPQQVMMLDAATGAEKGHFMPQGDYPGTHYWSPVALGGDSAYVGFADDRVRFSALYAFNPTSGQEEWHVEGDGLIIAAPAYANGTVYFGTGQGSVYAVDTASHTVKPGWPFKTGDAIWGVPLVDNGRVYVPSMDHSLYCLDGNSGELIWKFTATGALAASPRLDAGKLYQGAFDARVHAVDSNTGQADPGFDFKAGNWIWSPVLIQNNRVYVTSLDGKLYALDAATGQPVPGFTPYTVPVSTDYLRAAPAASGDLVIVTSGEGRVAAVNADTGQVAWQFPSGGAAPTSPALTDPVVADGRVYFILMNGEVWALDATNGAQAGGWKYELPTQKK
jgi:eukaryotic-like serine/threonine-protein kinase